MRRPSVTRTIQVVFLSLAIATPALAAERILSYHSDIVVSADSSMVVTETIRVVAEGDEIKRGIYRDFPTSYKGPFFTRVQVPFEVLSVTRNGQSDGWHTENRDNGIRLYVGRSDVFIDQGEHTYEIRYSTARQIGYFDDHDELYWNVTGTEWAFPIEKASATVILPSSLHSGDIRHEGYTGYEGSKGGDYTSDALGENSVIFETTRSLSPLEGLTIVAMFPKGHVYEPTNEERQAAFWDSNPMLTWGGVMLGIVFAYYLIAWFLVGRDPEKGVIIPEFKPSEGISPAEARYLIKMGWDKTCFAVAVMNVAIKGYAKLIEEDGEFTLRSSNAGREALSAGEQKIEDILLSSGSIEFKTANHKKISKAIDAHKEVLKIEHVGQRFEANRGYMVPGILLSIAGLVATIFQSGGEVPIAGVFMMVWITGWSAGVAGLVTKTIGLWKTVFRTGLDGTARGLAMVGAIFMTGFSLPFVAGLFFGLFALGVATSVWVVPMLLILVLLNAVFWFLIKAPTLAGRKVMDRIEGFQMYLGTAEEDRVKAMRGPEKTPELFERYLPYAIALDVENEWAEQFEDILSAAATGPADQGYTPSFYSGSSFSNLQTAAFAGAIGGALAGAIASSSTAPGSSSGGGGGGSSGGGGGGGGGGGW